MRPLVHIGYHKTGTSWFQKRVYPRLTSHYVVNQRAIRETLMSRDAFDFDPAAARAALELDRPDQPAILCEEDLSGVLHQGLASTYIAKEMAHRLHAMLPEAHILIFVRAQRTAALSWYHQYVREGGTASLRRYLLPQQHRFLGKGRPFKIPCFNFAELDYRGLIETYDALYGRENVTVLPYEALVHDRAGVLHTIGALVDTELPDPGAERVNSAFRIGLLPLLRFANLFTARSILAKRYLVHIPYWYAGRKWLFRQLNRLPIFGPPPRPGAGIDGVLGACISDRFWRSNRWLEERMGWDLRALGYALDPPEKAVIEPSASRRLRWIHQ